MKVKRKLRVVRVLKDRDTVLMLCRAGLMREKVLLLTMPYNVQYTVQSVAASYVALAGFRLCLRMLKKIL